MSWLARLEDLKNRPAVHRARTDKTDKTNLVSFVSSSPVHHAMNSDLATAVIASRWWLVHYADGEPIQLGCAPPTTHAEILERRPDAIAAWPFEPTLRQPSAPFTVVEETAIREWLRQIDEPDPAIIDDVVHRCGIDAPARDYFIGRAGKAPRPDAFVRSAKLWPALTEGKNGKT